MNTNKTLIIVEPTKDGLWAYIPSIPGCTSFGKDFMDLKTNLKEAIGFHIEGMIEDGEEIPVISDFENDLEYQFDLSTFFSEFPITVSGIAKRTGINRSLLNQYVKGIKHLTLERAAQIQNAIRSIGNEISSVNFT
jgi:predicted RNase H-like HicB family nuclease